jgi:hypothetical protein
MRQSWDEEQAVGKSGSLTLPWTNCQVGEVLLGSVGSISRTETTWHQPMPVSFIMDQNITLCQEMQQCECGVVLCVDWWNLSGNRFSFGNNTGPCFIVDQLKVFLDLEPFWMRWKATVFQVLMNGSWMFTLFYGRWCDLKRQSRHERTGIHDLTQRSCAFANGDSHHMSFSMSKLLGRWWLRLSQLLTSKVTMFLHSILLRLSLAMLRIFFSLMGWWFTPILVWIGSEG